LRFILTWVRIVLIAAYGSRELHKRRTEMNRMFHIITVFAVALSTTALSFAATLA
jgi:hypothetical protein